MSCFKPFTTPKLGFEVWKNPGKLLTVSKFQKYAYTIQHPHLQKVRILDGLKLLRKQFYAGSFQLISCDTTAEEITSFKRGGKILFTQGQSRVLNRTEQMPLKEIYKASLCRRLGSGKNIGKAKWKTQVAPAGPAGGPDAVWEFWDQCSWFHLPLIPCTTSGK